MYVCIHICISMPKYVNIYIYIVYKCICMHEYMYVCMHVCIVCVYTCVHASMCICMYICMHVCIHVCIYVILKLDFERYGGIVLVGRGNCPGNFPGYNCPGNCPGGIVRGETSVPHGWCTRTHVCIQIEAHTLSAD